MNIEYLQETTSQLYLTLYGNKVNAYADAEIVLASNDGSKIIFYQCNKEGHKAYQCPYKHNGNNKHSDNSKNSSNRGRSHGRRKFNVSCSCCGKEGSKNADCWYKPHNTSKRPSWYKKYERNSKETGPESTDYVEVLLCQTITEDRKGESEEDHGAEYI